MDNDMLREEIHKFLKTQFLMSLSSHGETPWPAVLYYVHDDDLNLFFTSNPKSKHGVNISSNPTVTITVFDSTTTVAQPKFGLQILGEAEQVSQLDSIKWMVKMWNRHIATEPTKQYVPEDLMDKGKSRAYKVTPKTIQYFNKNLIEGKPFATLQL